MFRLGGGELLALVLLVGVIGVAGFFVSRARRTH